MVAMLGKRGFAARTWSLFLAAALAGGLALQVAPPVFAGDVPEPVPSGEVVEPTGTASASPEPASPPLPTPAASEPEPTTTPDPEPEPTATPGPEPEPTATPDPEPEPSASTPPTESPGPDVLAQAAESMTVTPDTLRAFSGKSFEASLTITGGTAPYTASATNVPEGLSFDPANLTFSGTPTNSGSLVTVTVSDSGQPQQTVVDYVYVDVSTYREPSVYVGEGLSYPGFNGFRDGVVGRAYDVPLGHNGVDLENTTVSAISGQLPPGLSVSRDWVSGVPASAGTYHFTLRVQDRYGFKDQSFSIIVHALGMETAGYPVPPAVLGEPYSAKIASATGGVSPYDFSYATERHFAGGLSWSDPGPDGLYVDANGYLTGTPTVAGSFRIRVFVTDGDDLTQDIFWTTVTVLETRPPGEEPPGDQLPAAEPPAAQPPAAGEAPRAAVRPAGAVQSTSYVALAATGLQSGSVTAILWTSTVLVMLGAGLTVAARRSRRRGGTG